MAACLKGPAMQCDAPASPAAIGRHSHANGLVAGAETCTAVPPPRSAVAARQRAAQTRLPWCVPLRAAGSLEPTGPGDRTGPGSAGNPETRNRQAEGRAATRRASPTRQPGLSFAQRRGHGADEKSLRRLSGYYGLSGPAGRALDSEGRGGGCIAPYRGRAPPRAGLGKVARCVAAFFAIADLKAWRVALCGPARGDARPVAARNRIGFVAERGERLNLWLCGAAALLLAAGRRDGEHRLCYPPPATARPARGAARRSLLLHGSRRVAMAADQAMSLPAITWLIL